MLSKARLVCDLACGRVLVLFALDRKNANGKVRAVRLLAFCCSWMVVAGFVLLFGQIMLNAKVENGDE